MEKSNYKRLRIGGIALCILLALSCVIPVAVFASQSASDVETDTVHFINPTAITVVGDYLYVADTIENNKSALLCFKIDGNSSVSLVHTCEMNGVITELSSDGEKTIYAVMGKSVAEINVENGAVTLTDVVYGGFEKDVVGFVKGTFNGNPTLYALTNNLLRRNNATGIFGNATKDNWTDTKGCLALGEIVFYVYKSASNSGYLCSGYTSEGYILSNSLPVTEPIGIVEYDGKVAFFSKHSLSYVNDITMGYWIENEEFQGNGLETLISDTGDKTIADVAIKNFGEENKDSTIFVLNEGINKIDIYTKQGKDYAVADTIGSDMVDKKVPTSYTSFTLVRPKGYPTNIIYKTNAETSIDEIITDANEYVILGYEGDSSSHYYYVMIGDKFGWVKKSDGAGSPENDGKLTVVNNRLGDNEIGYTTKFVTLNAVYVYDLPLSGANKKAVTQSASAMKNVNVLQRFTEGEQVWYLVEYDENAFGFVKKEDVGQFHITAKTEEIPVIGQRKINSSLFSAVSMHATAELNEDETVTDSDGNAIKLYSGDLVTLVKTEGDAAFISVRTASDGERSYGWIEANRLIGKNAMTTNAIVGLSLIAFALVLAGTLIFVFLHRRKKIKANKD